MNSERPVRRWSVTVLILALIFALAAPSIAFSAVLLLRADNINRVGLSVRASQGVEAIADTLDRELRNIVTNLSVLAASGWIETEAYDLLHQRATTALQGTGDHLMAVDAEGQQILNTRAQWGEPLGKIEQSGAVRAALATGMPTVSNIGPGVLTKRESFEVVFPILSAEVQAQALIMSRDTESLERVFMDSLPPPGWSFAVLDSAGNLVAGTAPRVGGADMLTQLCASTQPGLQQVREAGVNFSASSERLSVWNWRACVWTSSDQLEEAILQRWRSFTILALVLVAVTIVGGAALGRLLAGSIRRAAAVGRALDAGGDVAEQRSMVREVDEVLATLTRAARRRLQHDEELRLLLRETAHRAKNQLAITAALVRLSARSAQTVDQLRDDIVARLSALGRSIDMMPETPAGSVAIAEMVETQLEPFASAQPGRLLMQGDNILAPPALAQALALVLHEKATNATKYGALSGDDGHVRVTWTVRNGVLEVVWAEEGGPPASEPVRTGFGTSLVDMLIEKTLGGSVTRDYRDMGLVCTMRMPLERDNGSTA